MNGKSYIGSAVNISIRLSKYFQLSQLIIHNVNVYKALLKYGYSNFSLEILEYCHKKDCINREQFYLDSLQPEYNLNPIAGSRQGSFQSSDTKNKSTHFMSLIGRTLAEEARLKMSQAKKGSNHPFFGKTRSQDTKDKIIIHEMNDDGTTIFVYSLQYDLLFTFSSSRSAAKYFSCDYTTILRYARSGRKKNTQMRVFFCISLEVKSPPFK